MSNYKSTLTAIIFGASVGFIAPYIYYRSRFQNDLKQGLKKFRLEQIQPEQIITLRDIIDDAIKRKDFDCLNKQLQIVNNMEFLRSFSSKLITDLNKYFSTIRTNIDEIPIHGNYTSISSTSELLGEIITNINNINNISNITNQTFGSFSELSPASSKHTT